jgi:hypothetical protein
MKDSAMIRASAASALALTCWALLGSCEGDSTREAPARGSASAPVESPKVSQDSTDLVEAAKTIVAFLRGEVDFDQIRVADTVSLYLAPEAGGTRRNVSRAVLRNRSNWTVRSASLPNAPGMTYSLVPSKGAAELTLRVGRHLKCLEYPLASIFPELADSPHVGIMLAYGTDSCLQTRNFTLVFDPRLKPPTLVAAVYDQWEW